MDQSSGEGRFYPGAGYRSPCHPQAGERSPFASPRPPFPHQQHVRPSFADSPWRSPVVKSPRQHSPYGASPTWTPTSPHWQRAPSPDRFRMSTPLSGRGRGSGHRYRQQWSSQGNCNPGGSNNILDYVSDEMLKDPWEELEKQLQHERNQQNINSS